MKNQRIKKENVIYEAKTQRGYEPDKDNFQN